MADAPADLADRAGHAPVKQGFCTELHAARGLAAAVVVIGHCLCVPASQDGTYDYIRSLFAGSTAVTFFFVLSGLVLAISLRKSNAGMPQGYLDYLLRRFFRLAPLLFVTVIAGTIYVNWLDPKATYAFASDWWTQQFKSSIDPVHFVVALTGFSPRPNPPSWSIFVELVGSLFVPFMVAVAYAGRKHALALTALLLVFGLNAFERFPALQTHQWNLYLVDFFAGILILCFGKSAFTRLGRSPAQAGIVAVALLIALLHVRYFGLPLFGEDRAGLWTVNLVELLLIVPIVGLLFHCRQHFSLLNAKPMQFLGDISYSLYLVHFVVLAVIANTVAILLPQASSTLLTGLIVVLEAAICIPLANMTYRRIELPGIRMGQMLVARLRVARPLAAR